MKVPVGFLEKLWSFVSFLPYFFLLFILGLLKAVITGPIVLGIILIANSAVIIGLWPAHFLWTLYCVVRTKRLGPILKIVVLVALPVPLILWPIVGILGNLLGGIGYGFFAPLFATFEDVGENITDKCYHCFVDGCLSPIRGSCRAVQDFTDFCFHSYFSYMDELSEKVPKDEKPIDIKLSKLPSCFLACLIGVLLDVLLISTVALWKSPFMLFKGWKRLLEDLIGREGPFLETVVVLLLVLQFLLWPLDVVGAVLAAIISSFFLGLYAGVIVHQERKKLGDKDNNELMIRREGSLNAKLVSERSRTLKKAIQQYKAIQVWDWLFKSCKVNGRILLRDGLISINDIEECIAKGNCRKLGIKLPTWSILQCLLASAKSDSAGLMISDDLELTRMNSPSYKVLDWFIEPLLIIKEQIKMLQLDINEEICPRKLVMEWENEKTEEWYDSVFPSSDNVKKAQLQAIIRRLQGIVASMSRIPTFDAALGLW